MYASYKINPFVFTASTATTINIPITLEPQLVDNAELIDRIFVKDEMEKAVNPILDYDKVRFFPVDSNKTHVNRINYSLNFLSGGTLQTPTFYSTIEITNDDLKFRRNFFKESYLSLSFYDTDNPLTQTLKTQIDIYDYLSDDDLIPAGQSNAGFPKPANQIPVRFRISNPLTNPRGYFEGFHIFTYKDEYEINNPPKSLYMQATYFNAKTGKWTNFMNEASAPSIDVLVTKLYTKYNLFRDTTGFYYEVDTAYSSNVSYTSTSNPNMVDLNVQLYEVQVS